MEIPGSFWHNCEEEDLDMLYPIRVKTFDAARKTQGRSGAAPMFGFVLLRDEDQVYMDDPYASDGRLWMGINMFSQYYALHLNRNPPPPPPPAPSPAPAPADAGEEKEDAKEIIIVGETRWDGYHDTMHRSTEIGSFSGTDPRGRGRGRRVQGKGTGKGTGAGD